MNQPKNSTQWDQLMQHPLFWLSQDHGTENSEDWRAWPFGIRHLGLECQFLHLLDISLMSRSQFSYSCNNYSLSATLCQASHYMFHQSLFKGLNIIKVPEKALHTMSGSQSALHGSYYNFIAERDFILLAINLNYLYGSKNHLHFLY